MRPESQANNILRLRGMTKRYGSVVACDSVDFDLVPGEIHGVLGENGAGKSTLMRMAIGMALPDGGTIEIDGETLPFVEPSDAARLGMGMVHQEYSLIDALTVWENVELGERGTLDPAHTKRRIGEIAEAYGLDVDPDAVVRDLSVGVRQRVEIVKCLRHNPRIIILDEPTSGLSPAESAQLLEVLRTGVRREGWAVALVSHKLDEVLAVADRITVLRQGKVVERTSVSETDASSLARAMVGRPVTVGAGSAAIGASIGESVPGETGSSSVDILPILEIQEASVEGSDGAVLLDRLSLTVRPGEVVGIAGAEGNGQVVLEQVLSSLVELDSGKVLVAGREIETGVAGAMHRSGVAVTPSDRQRSGCAPHMSVAENLMLGRVAGSRGLVHQAELDRNAKSLIGEYGIRASSPGDTLSMLSGGNQQRVMLARSLAPLPKVLVAAQPTRGLDVAAVEYVSMKLDEAAAQGVGVLLISSDLDEIAAMTHRIVVISRGAIVGEMDRSDLDMERLGMMIGGSADAEQES